MNQTFYVQQKLLASECDTQRREAGTMRPVTSEQYLSTR
jgi:hypothetical protein